MILPLVSVLPSSGHIGENLTAESLQMSEYFPLISVSLVSEKHADQSTALLYLQKLHEATKSICKKNQHLPVSMEWAQLINIHEQHHHPTAQQSRTQWFPQTQSCQAFNLGMFFRIIPVKSIVRLSKLLSLINAFMTEVDGLCLHLNIKNFYSALIHFLI